MRELARRTIPGMFANSFFGNRMNFIFALSAVPTSLAGAARCMPELVFRAIPAVSTGRCFVGIVTRTALTIGAIPVAAGTGFVKRMPGLIFGTTPTMFAGIVRTVTDTVAVIAIGTPPMMRTAVGLSINSRRRIRSETVDTEPVTVRAGTVRRMVRFFAPRTHPVVRTAFGVAQNLFTTFVRTVYVTVRAGVG